jgi:C-terminal processing protease CtpA/Prc
VPGGAADLDGRLCTGDEIVNVDSQSVLSTSHHHVVQLMGKAAANGHVTLGIRRRIPTQGNHLHGKREREGTCGLHLHVRSEIFIMVQIWTFVFSL